MSQTIDLIDHVKIVNRLNDRIRKLEEHKNSQIDENKKLWAVINHDTNILAKHSDSISTIDTFIHKLIEHKNCQIDENRKVSRRLDEVEHVNSVLDTQLNGAFNRISDKQYYSIDKKPHQCPVCHGIGEIIEEYQTIFGIGGTVTENNVRATCHPCKGIGIVWG